MQDEIDFEFLEELEEYNTMLENEGFSKGQREELLRLSSERHRISEAYKGALDARDNARAAADAAWAEAGIDNPVDPAAVAEVARATRALAEHANEIASATREAYEQAAPADKAAAMARHDEAARALANALEAADRVDAAAAAEAAYRVTFKNAEIANIIDRESHEAYGPAVDAIKTRDEIEMPPEYVGRADAGAGDVEHIEMPPEPAREQAEPPGSEAAPIEGDASSRLMDDGGGAFSGDEGEGAPDAAAANAAVGGATVGGVTVGAAGDRFSIGDTIKDVSEPILGPLGDAEDAVKDETTNVYTDSDGNLWVDRDDYNRTVREYNDLLEHTESQQQVEALADAAEDVGESVEDFVGGIPLIGEDFGDALREGYDVVEDGVDHMDDPA